jgi:chemosensory pili system protein ChpA (sensor histidine kinase/response regulator)
MDIFLEEIDDEIVSARERLARWSLDPRDASAGTGLKRHFSVIKGSGLLVGARTVAQVAESVEELLGRVTAQPTRDPAATSFIAEVLDQLPALVHGGNEDRAAVVRALVARAGQIAETVRDAGLEGGGLSALVHLDGLTGSGDAPQIPIEDLLDTFGVAPEVPGEWVLPDVDESSDTAAVEVRSAPTDALELSAQTLGEELDPTRSALLDPAIEPSDGPVADSALVPSSASLVEQIAEIARCREELDITHAQMVSGLDALDLGLARLRELVDRLASDPYPSGRPLAEGVDDTGEAIEQREFCGRVDEILDDLESVGRGLITDRQASEEPRARQAKLLEAVLDALVKRQLGSAE